jgi:hypothetical protein
VTKQADFKRRVRERMSKTGESYATARRQLLSSQGDVGRRELAAALHVTNGDITADTLERGGVSRRVLPWRDALHEGPVPAVPEDELRRIRADFLAGDESSRRGEILRLLRTRDETVTAGRGGHYVLWFEADVYDQLQLAQILARLGELQVPPSRITLICIGEYPGIAHFGGLGELDALQLEGLLATNAAAPVSTAAVELAGRAWAALCAPDPVGLIEIAAAPSPELRFLAEAFERLAREYPSTRDGLSLTERRILAALADGGSTAGQAHARIGAREARPYLGDGFCFDIIARLVVARSPLLEAELPVAAGTRVRVTDAGRAVLDGTADHVALNGIDRWIGGVHLVGEEARWRWNEGTETLTAM